MLVFKQCFSLLTLFIQMRISLSKRWFSLANGKVLGIKESLFRICAWITVSCVINVPGSNGHLHWILNFYIQSFCISYSHRRLMSSKTRTKQNDICEYWAIFRPYFTLKIVCGRLVEGPCSFLIAYDLLGNWRN